MAAAIRCILLVVSLHFFTTFCEVCRHHVCLPGIERAHRDCREAFVCGWTQSGVYTVAPDGITRIKVYCEQQLGGGGWTVIQRRYNGSVDFYRDWAAYKTGFGNLSGEFWLGNDNINLLTKGHDQKVKVELLYHNETAYADYSTFWIDNETLNYTLTVADFSGADPPGDSLTDHNQSGFSTKDRDNDDHLGNCTEVWLGAWWYDRVCSPASLNGRYCSIIWDSWKLDQMTGTQMMVKRKP